MENKHNSIVCIAGKNEIAVYGLHLLMKYVNKDKILVVYNIKDDPEPGFNTWQPSLLKAAKENNIRIISIEEFYSLDNIIFLSLEFYKIITPEKFSNSELFNIHFSKLPSYKGMYTSALPILNNESQAGVTLHEIDSGIDTGDIVDQITFPIEKEDSVRDLYFKYLENSKKLLEKNISSILKRETISYPQPPEASTYFSSKTIDYKNLEVKLFATADQVRNQIRAFFFPEYQVPKVHGFFVNFAIINTQKSTNKPGEILSITEDHIIISTIDYDVTLLRDKNSELIESAINNDKRFALECIECGANINYRYGKNGMTPLLTASINGSIDIVKLLIKSGADINLSDYQGNTSLMYAMKNYEKNGKRNLFDFLIQNGGDIELKDIHSKTIKDYAIQRNIFGLFK